MIKLRRPFGVRTHLGAGMLLLALVSVAVTGALIRVAVDAELRKFGRQDLQRAASRTAAVAEAAYRQSDGWRPAWVRVVVAPKSSAGHAVEIVGADGRRLRGSPPRSLRDPARAPVIVGGRRVGTVAVGYPRG